MPSKPLRFIVPTNSLNQRVLVSDYLSPSSQEVSEMVRDDTVIAYTIEPVIENQPGSDPIYSPDYETSDTFQLAIGEPDEAPTGGEANLLVGSTPVDIDYNVTAAALETLLNAALTTEAEPLCQVTLISAGVYQLDAVSDGAIASGFFDVDSSSLLVPESDVIFNEQSLGSASTRYQVLLVMVQSPVALSVPSTELPSTDVDLSTVSAGSATTNKIQKVSFDVEDTYTGSFSVAATTTGSDTSTCGVATPGMSAEEFGLLLAVHVNIHYLDSDGTADNIRVSKNNGAFFVEFIGTLKNSSTPGITVANIDLLGPVGKSGTINLNTIGLYKKSRLTTADTFTLQISITRSRTTGERRTILLTNITLKKEIVDPVSMVPTPRANYYTEAETDALLTGYQELLVNSAGLRAALSDETGSGLAVFNNAPTILAPVIGTGGTSIALIKHGRASLVAGTVNVTAAWITSNAIVVCTGIGVTDAGFLYVNINGGASFDITSDNASDARDVSWIVIEP